MVIKPDLFATVFLTTALFSAFSARADVALSGLAAIGMAKKCSDVTQANVDAAWIRADLNAAVSLPRSPMSGLVHVRIQPDFGSKAGDSRFNLQARQIYVRYPVSILEVVAGRWYEKYGPGYNYFGRYLMTKTITSGTGDMSTDYTIVDGLKMGLRLDAIRSAFALELLPQDAAMEHARVAAILSGSPAKRIKLALGANFDALVPEHEEAVHRAMVNCGVSIIENGGLNLFGEMAVIDMDEPTDNMWFTTGFSCKAGRMLDRIQIEFEIKNHRNGDPTTDGNLAWMVALRKKVTVLTLDLNVGADPTTLGSKEISDIGAVFRATVLF